MTSVPRPGALDLERHRALADQEEAIGRVALAEQLCAGGEVLVGRRIRRSAARCACDSPANSGAARDQLLKRLHRHVASLSRIARASSVMSMPTGHHVMQRPQPTQPELPNWSIQVASLWVIHWR